MTKALDNTENKGFGLLWKTWSRDIIPRIGTFPVGEIWDSIRITTALTTILLTVPST
jgi:hypothetical protein